MTKHSGQERIGDLPALAQAWLSATTNVSALKEFRLLHIDSHSVSLTFSRPTLAIAVCTLRCSPRSRNSKKEPSVDLFRIENRGALLSVEGGEQASGRDAHDKVTGQGRSRQVSAGHEGSRTTEWDSWQEQLEL